MKNLGRLLLGFLFLVLAVEVLILAPDELDPVEESVTTSLDTKGIKQVMEGAHLLETRNEAKEWELWADRAVEYANTENWELEKVKALFFTKDNVSFKVTGTRGSVDVKSKNMEILGDVVTESSNGYVFRTDKMIYNSEMRRLWSPSEVSAKGPKDRKGNSLLLSGTGMETDLAEAKMMVQGPVNAHKAIPDNRELVVKSESAQFSAQSNDAKFIGNVTMDAGSMRISGPEAKFQFDPDKGAVSIVEVNGGARVSDRNKWATSKSVKFFLEQDRLEFKGKPRLVQGNDQLVGDKIIFLNGGKRVQVLKARARLDKGKLEK